MIREIEKFGAELQPKPFPQSEAFHESEIEVEEAGPVENSSARVAEGAAWRNHKRLLIEPMSRVACSWAERIDPRKAIGPLSARAREGVITGDAGCKWKSGLQ